MVAILIDVYRWEMGGRGHPIVNIYIATVAGPSEAAAFNRLAINSCSPTPDRRCYRSVPLALPPAPPQLLYGDTRVRQLVVSVARAPTLPRATLDDRLRGTDSKQDKYRGTDPKRKIANHV